jgi:hypothetical protein
MDTASDLGTVTMLTATNAKLASQPETSQNYINKLKEVITDLKVKMKPA